VTPTTAKALLDAGYEVRVERSTQRIFDDKEFAAVGCPLLPEGSWTGITPRVMPGIDWDD
jgi:NAD/NADP transhydrogenase alpha subunit